MISAKDLGAVLHHGGAKETPESRQDACVRLAFDLLTFLVGSMQLIERELGVSTSGKEKKEKEEGKER